MGTDAIPQDRFGRRRRVPGEAPEAFRLDRRVTDRTIDICEYIEERTGYDVDPRSVDLFQQLLNSWLKSERGEARREASRKRNEGRDPVKRRTLLVDIEEDL